MREGDEREASNIHPLSGSRMRTSAADRRTSGQVQCFGSFTNGEARPVPFETCCRLSPPHLDACEPLGSFSWVAGPGVVAIARHRLRGKTESRDEKSCWLWDSRIST
ncbi:hypothetical protein MAPG_05378 [Magnaporthiopsis poae ATCC 64411]|uniref:Uncharacterized protein n=1 Tax=Magnaporthiopsis poae (strain ATCC 64411 / 73-15) TaxID=644358 RepID=A0A0C4DZ86_MAGP6|nr:hypothetical protein MAPG_05378 [Magnaporthiopsis poae ATCC 64411]